MLWSCLLLVPVRDCFEWRGAVSERYSVVVLVHDVPDGGEAGHPAIVGEHPSLAVPEERRKHLVDLVFVQQTLPHFPNGRSV